MQRTWYLVFAGLNCEVVCESGGVDPIVRNSRFTIPIAVCV
jgi:hypothetical protein